jgi:hypothetical protein
MGIVPTGELTTTEQRIVDAFGDGSWVEAADGDESVRAEVLAGLLLRGAVPVDGAVPALRLRGARITGTLSLTFATVSSVIQLDDCLLDGSPDLSGAITRSVELTGCVLPGVTMRLAHVDGDLRVSDCTVTGTLMLKNAHVAGALSVSGSTLSNPGGRSLDAGGLVIGGGLFGHRGLRTEGEARLVGARVDGGLRVEGAHFTNPGGVALCADGLVTSRMLFQQVRTEGELQLRGARVSGEINLRDAHLDAEDKAVRGRGLSTGELFLTPASVRGLVDLSWASVGALRDSEATWPSRLRLDGLTYDHLIPFTAVDARRRCAWLARDIDGYRPQPYEQLAAYYRRLGDDHEARLVLLAKQRARRATLPPPTRALGYLLDVLVGYGYRSWLAGVWLSVLLAAGTAVFLRTPPEVIDLEYAPRFHAFIYTLDLLVPVDAFGLRTAYDPQGWTVWVAYGLIASGWILATALITGVTRSLRRE